MKKIILSLAMGICFVQFANAQVMDSSLTKKPGHKEETMHGDTTHSTRKNRTGNPARNNRQNTDSTVMGMPATDNKNNTSKPSTNKPQ